MSISRLPPTEMGVRTTREGEAVAEISFPLETAFDLTEGYLRKYFKVTFVNHSISKLECENKQRWFVIDFTDLTTGKIGLSVKAVTREENQLDLYAARELADEIIKILQAYKPEKIPLKMGDVNPR